MRGLRKRKLICWLLGCDPHECPKDVWYCPRCGRDMTKEIVG
jgi:hypothetical protein